ncbi:MAG: DUF4870 domain-containing protein [Pseudomonadota bacterium]
MSEIITSSPSNDERNMSMLAHLLGIFTGFVGALVIWLIKKDESVFVAEEAKEALNFQITMMIGYLIASALFIILIGVVLLPILWIVNLVFCILGAVAASKGSSYKYPFAIRLVK